MTDLTTIGGSAATMTTIDLRDMVNEARVAAGEPKVRNDQFIARVQDELGEELGVCKKIAHPQSGVLMDAYDLTRDQCMLVAMRESKAVRRRVVAKLNQLEKQANSFHVPSTRAEALRLAADLEEQNAALQLENHHQAETIASLESLFLSGETPTQFCKRLNGVNCSKVNSTLCQLGWLFNEQREEEGAPRYRVASRVRDKYLTERPRKIAAEGGDSFIKYDLQLLLAGAQRLHQLYMQQKLAMKATWDGRFTQAKYAGEAI